MSYLAYITICKRYVKINFSVLAKKNKETFINIDVLNGITPK
jgi:hypothetical protein